MESSEPAKRVAVVGGGISGLVAARRLIDQGYQVEIYDGAKRLGGKIKTVALGDGLADRAAEFIDTEQQSIIDLCKELNVRLIPSQDPGSLTARYFTRSGTVLSEEAFGKAYRPISKQIAEDKAAVIADPDGGRAQRLDGLSVSQYLQQLAANVKDERPWWKKIIFFWQKKPSVDPDIIHMAEQGFASERGRPASQMSALQFVHETGSDSGELIPGDCALRIEGGTQKLIDALQRDLQAKGARFHLDAKATEIRKHDGKFNIAFEKMPEGLQDFDQVVMATQSHNLANIKGMDKLLSPEDQDTLQQLQYTHNTKFTIKTKVPVKNDGFFLSRAGYQCWKRAPGEIVFMLGDDLPAKYKPKDLVDLVLKDYARAHNTSVDALFDKSMVDYHGADVQKPCYPSPKQGEYLKLRRLAQSFDKLAEQGIGVVGTYIPAQLYAGYKGGGESANRMGHGVECANHAVELMSGGRAQEQVLSLSPERKVSYVDQLLAQRSQAGWIRQ